MCSKTKRYIENYFKLVLYVLHWLPNGPTGFLGGFVITQTVCIWAGEGFKSQMPWIVVFCIVILVMLWILQRCRVRYDEAYKAASLLRKYTPKEIRIETLEAISRHNVSANKILVGIPLKILVPITYHLIIISIIFSACLVKQGYSEIKAANETKRKCEVRIQTEIKDSLVWMTNTQTSITGTLSSIDCYIRNVQTNLVERVSSVNESVCSNSSVLQERLNDIQTNVCLMRKRMNSLICTNAMETQDVPP